MVEGNCIVCGKIAKISEKGTCKGCYLKVFIKDWYQKHPDKYEAHKAKMRDYMRQKYLSNSFKSRVMKELSNLKTTLLCKFPADTADGIFIQSKILEIEKRLGFRL